ncbi:MAG: hypothetical protein AB7U98_03555 [Candidatus Nitrosocosmicus sp.]
MTLYSSRSRFLYTIVDDGDKRTSGRNLDYDQINTTSPPPAELELFEIRLNDSRSIWEFK